MFGFFGMFGRADELQALDKALGAAGLAHKAVPDAVKLAALRQLQQQSGRKHPGDAAYEGAADLLAYCLLGANGFAEAAGHSRLETVEARIDAAVASGDNLDARLLLLALHADLVQPDIVERYELQADSVTD